MFCRYCGASIAEDAQFCAKCGKAQTTPTAGVGGGTAVQQQPSAPPEPTKKSSATRWVLFAVVLLILFIGVKLSEKSSSAPSVPMARQHFSNPWVNESFTIEPRKYRYWNITATSQTLNQRITGHFEATGGSGNDVEVFLLDEDGFTNFKNGHSTRTLYNSGKVTAGTIDVPLPFTGDSKTYYLVFSNTFSLLTNKAVQAKVDFAYEL
jgi:hypothetical protein